MGQVAVAACGEFGDACLGGMKIQRLIRMCDKLTIMDRRMMTAMGDWWEFVRIFTAEVLHVEWSFMDGKMCPAIVTATSGIFVGRAPEGSPSEHAL